MVRVLHADEGQHNVCIQCNLLVAMLKALTMRSCSHIVTHTHHSTTLIMATTDGGHTSSAALGKASCHVELIMQLG
jgi:hypothetical protein